MAKIFYDQDVNWDVIKNRKVAIIGYGSQGHAHALNLRDSGLAVKVGLYKGSKSAAKAEAAGLEVVSVSEAAKWADIIMILIPDEKQADVYKNEIAPYLKSGDALAFAHGFNIHFQQVVPPADVDVFMVAPKGPGHLVRREFREGLGVPNLIAVGQDATGKCFDLALAYSRGLGGTRAGAILTTFKEETETDLFGEQCVLCGGISELMESGFNTLVAAGYQPEIAYFECFHEMKLIVDLCYEGGLQMMRYSVSDTAEFGDYHMGKHIITDEVRASMRKALTAIQDGSFAKEFLLENRAAGRAHFLAERRRHSQTQLEQVGKQVRSMMSWLRDAKTEETDNNEVGAAKKAPAKKAPAKKAAARKTAAKK